MDAWGMEKGALMNGRCAWGSCAGVGGSALSLIDNGSETF